MHFARLAAIGVVLAFAVPEPSQAQSSGAVIMRSEGHITWWVVDEASGQAAFFGGDIVAICNDSQDLDGYDLLDFRTVTDPRNVAMVMQGSGDEVGTSLWASAPPFVGGRLCRDILSREGPVATGTSQIQVSGRFPVTWADPDVRNPFGMTAMGTLHTPGGSTLYLNAHYRCASTGEESEMSCTYGLDVR